MEELLGGFLVIEAGISILASQDQRVVSNIGRGLRILVGIWLIRQGTTFHQLQASNGYDGVKRKSLKR